PSEKPRRRQHFGNRQRSEQHQRNGACDPSGSEGQLAGGRGVRVTVQTLKQTAAERPVIDSRTAAEPSCPPASAIDAIAAAHPIRILAQQEPLAAPITRLLAEVG